MEVSRPKRDNFGAKSIMYQNIRKMVTDILQREHNSFVTSEETPNGIKFFIGNKTRINNVDWDTEKRTDIRMEKKDFAINSKEGRMASEISKNISTIVGKALMGK